MGRMGFVSPGGVVGVEVGCFNGATTCAGHMQVRHNGVVIGLRNFSMSPESGGFRNLKLTPAGRRLLNHSRPWHLLKVDVTIVGTNGQVVSQLMSFAKWLWR